MSNTFGHSFRITTWGESHGDAVGVVVDGCPPRVALELADIQSELDRRRPGQSEITTQRKESDRAEILSGVFDGLTLGTPILIGVWNEDQRSKDYEHMRTKFRPSHADYTYQAKYGIRNWKGGGRASARETVGRVAAGAIARKVLAQEHGVEIVGVREAGVDAGCRRRPRPGDGRGCRVKHRPLPRPGHGAAHDRAHQGGTEGRRLPGRRGGGGGAQRAPGLGEPVFDKLEAELGRGVLSLPACKGFEIGSGFGGVTMTGSQHNDPFYNESGRIRTRTNRSGGVQGGISNGENIVIRAAFKPTATILRTQETVDVEGNPTTLEGRGRHDPCVLPRAVPMVEAMMALVLMDQALRQRAQGG